MKFEQEGPKMDDFKTKVFACEEEKNLRWITKSAKVLANCGM